MSGQSDRTVRVRIAVAVSMGDGGMFWSAFGQHDGNDDMSAMVVSDDLGESVGGPHHIVFVEADVPLPKPPTVKGEVSG